MNAPLRPAQWAGILVLVFGLFALPNQAASQGSAAGTLTGVVIDSNGGSLPGVTVVARAPLTGFEQKTVTNTAGDWRIAVVPSGVYEVSFELDGFKKLVRSDIRVEAATVRTIPVTLEIGSVSENISVSADAPLLTPTAPTTARSLTAEELRSVPTTTGSFTHLLSSEAGVSADLPPVL